MAVVSMSYLLEAGVHFGHQTKRWNPKMKEYIYTSRDDIYIIDLQKTAKKIEEAYVALKEIAANGGNATYRGTVRIKESAHNSIANIKCDTILLDETAKSDTIPKNKIDNNSSYIEHEATVSKISKDKLFYLMSRGINEEKAKELLIMGFIDRFREELPMEYAVELNALLKNYF